MSPKPIVVVGSFNLGETVRVERLPKAGETLAGSGYSAGPGGKGSNQAIAARRLGGTVRFVGCVGEDRYGDEAVELWKSEGVSAAFVKRVRTHTGIAFIVVERSGANMITIDSGANLELFPEDVKAAARAFDGSGVVLTQLEIRPETAAAAAKAGRAAGATVILNPAPARPAEELDLANIDIMTPNEQEFAVLASTDDLEAGARSLLDRGPRMVVVTLGERGAYVATKGSSFRVPALAVEAVDSTGAGDAFSGALAVAISEEAPPKEAVRFANLAGAFTVTRAEVVQALPTREVLEKFGSMAGM